ncbi:hypothetical protein OSK62_22695, partial [Escherichia coli]|nr:hypothetical protein [Escherichia coli]
MFALADINSFYASCEKVFRPDLRNEPVIVLSNNHPYTFTSTLGNDSNLLIVFYVQIMPDDLVMQLHR